MKIISKMFGKSTLPLFSTFIRGLVYFSNNSSVGLTRREPLIPRLETNSAAHFLAE